MSCISRQQNLFRLATVVCMNGINNKEKYKELNSAEPVQAYVSWRLLSVCVTVSIVVCNVLTHNYVTDNCPLHSLIILIGICAL